MKLHLSILALATITSYTLAQYNYDPPQRGYEYPHPHVSFIEIPPTTTDSPITKSTLASVLTKKAPASSEYTYPKPTVPSVIQSTFKNNIQTISQVTYIPSLQSNALQLTKTSGYSYPHPLIPFTSATSHKPTLPTTPEIRTSTSFPTITGYIYTHPSIPFTIPERIPSTKPSSSPTSQTSKQTGYSYSKPNKPLTISSVERYEKGYTYSSPSVPFKYPAKASVTRLPNAPLLSPGNLSPPDARPPPKSSGYSYPPPKIPFPIPSNIPPTGSKSTAKVEPTQFLQPTGSAPVVKAKIRKEQIMNATYAPSEVVSLTNSVEYLYERPHIPFSLPLNLPDTTSAAPVTIPTKPTPSISKSVGYLYPSPDVPFTTPPKIIAAQSHDRKTIPDTNSTSPVAIPTKPTPSKSTGYSYPPPNVPYIIPANRKTVGYTYIPPAIPFNISPRAPVPTSLALGTKSSTYPTKSAKIRGFPEINNPSSKAGYTYTQPGISFITPQKTYTNPKPAVPFEIPQKIALTASSQEGGYTYPTPSIPFTIPTKPTPSISKSVGYLYPPPEVLFTTPPKIIASQSHDRKTIPDKNSISPVAIPTKPTPSVSKSTGYSYPPPNIPYIVPANRKTVGYTYIPPAIRFNISPRAPVPTSLALGTKSSTDPTKSAKIRGFPEINYPSSKAGYTYTQPGISFITPQKTYTNPEPAVPFEIPQKTALTASSQGGAYTYPTPSIPFEF